MSFAIVTDTCCNLSAKQANEWGIRLIAVRYYVDGVEQESNPSGDYTAAYEKLRARQKITTSLVSADQCDRVILPLLQAEQDVLIIAFSSGLSGSYENICRTAEEYRRQFPNREIVVVDSLCASLGMAMLLERAVALRNAGRTLADVAAELDALKLSICHDFTLDDLFFLKRGGRLSGSGALLGTLMQVKPMLYMADDGKLYVRDKVRGRRAAMQALVDAAAKNAVHPAEQTVYVAHGDCPADAAALASQLKSTLKVRAVRVGQLDPVIASHSGPGTLAVFYYGKHRLQK